MTVKEKEKLQLKADFFKALGQPLRLRIVEVLGSGELQAGELAFRLETALPNISKHLELLKHQGLIIDRKEGAKVFYRSDVQDFEKLMVCVDKAVWRRLACNCNGFDP